MFEYKVMELHSHSRHSDGRYTVPELCAAARMSGLDGIALTDHNTMSGWQDLTAELETETLPVIRGIEWTTFFGHMVVIGAERFVDWRFATPDTIDLSLTEVKAVNGSVGIAHPFNVGSPLCTGCHWDYRVTRWDLVDYIEVWSQSYDPMRYKNQMAFSWWTELLNQGHRIAASSGRDWHGPGKDGEIFPVTYLGVEDGIVNTNTARDALIAGRSYITCGPSMDIQVEAESRRYQLGESIPAGMISIGVALNMESRREIWDELQIQPQSLRLIQNGETALTKECTTECHFNYKAKAGWLRLELWGTCRSGKDSILAFTSPIYIE